VLRDVSLYHYTKPLYFKIKLPSVSQKALFTEQGRMKRAPRYDMGNFNLQPTFPDPVSCETRLATNTYGSSINKGAGRLCIDSLQESGYYLFDIILQPVLVPTKLPIQLMARIYPRGLSGRDLLPTSQLHLVPRSTMMELYLRSPVCLHGVVLSCKIKQKELKLKLSL
jgi:hypothetical protein